MNPKFKVWRLDIDEGDLETGVEYVALVDDPAILRTWQAFDTAQIKYKVDQNRRIVMGPLMIPNLPIYRNDQTHGEHFVTYSKESIEKICRKFFRQKNTGNVNLMHIPAATPNGAYMFESFIIDKARGLNAPEGFSNLPDGTWFGSYMISDDTIWSQVQAGTFKGFSVEGFFTYDAVKEMDGVFIENMIDAVKNGTPNNFRYLSTYKSPMQKEKISAALSAIKALFMDGESEAVLKDGTQVSTSGGLVQGSQIQIVTAEGKIPAPDGLYELADGTKLDVTGGVIMNVTAPEIESKETEKPEVMTEEFKSLKADFDAFKKSATETMNTVASTMKDVAEKFDSVLSENKALKTEFAKIQEGQAKVVTILKNLEETPGAEPVQKQVEKTVSAGESPRFIVDKFRGKYEKMKTASQFKVK